MFKIQELKEGEADRLRNSPMIVAEKFHKSHKNVLRAIDNLPCSQKFRVANFGESSYLNAQNKEQQKGIL